MCLLAIKQNSYALQFVFDPIIKHKLSIFIIQKEKLDKEFTFINDLDNIDRVFGFKDRYSRQIALNTKKDLCKFIVEHTPLILPHIHQSFTN
jgi:hypothetical protein